MAATTAPDPDLDDNPFLAIAARAADAGGQKRVILDEPRLPAYARNNLRPWLRGLPTRDPAFRECLNLATPEELRETLAYIRDRRHHRRRSDLIEGRLRELQAASATASPSEPTPAAGSSAEDVVRALHSIVDADARLLRAIEARLPGSTKFTAAHKAILARAVTKRRELLDRSSQAQAPDGSAIANAE